MCCESTCISPTIVVLYAAVIVILLFYCMVEVDHSGLSMRQYLDLVLPAVYG